MSNEAAAVTSVTMVVILVGMAAGALWWLDGFLGQWSIVMWVFLGFQLFVGFFRWVNSG
jgi:hypothetical protein